MQVKKLFMKFDTLSIEDRFLLLLKDGAFIDSIIYYNQKIDLYSIDSLYVEVTFCPETSKITRVASAEKCRIHLYSPVRTSDDIR